MSGVIGRRTTSMIALAHEPRAEDMPPEDKGLREQLELFSQVLYSIRNNYVDEPDDRRLIRGAIDGMLKTLDSRSSYRPADGGGAPDVAEGVGISFELERDVALVVGVAESGAADRAGIQLGDRIVAIDGHRLSWITVESDVLEALRGAARTVVNIRIARDGVPDLDIPVQREKAVRSSLPYSFMLRPGVAYVRVAMLDANAGRAFEKSLSTLRAQGMKAMVLDLRGCPGGLLSQAVDLIDQLVPQDRKLVSTRGRIMSANADYYSAERASKCTDAPLVVMIDHYTASGSEVIAGVLQELDRALVVGQTSFGSGLVQNQVRLRSGLLIVTAARIQTPSGRVIQREVPESFSFDSDPGPASRAGLPSDSTLNALPTFKSASGRVIRGGGGICPDVFLPPPPSPSPLGASLRARRVFQYFATYYMELHPKTPSDSLGSDFTLTESEWAHLREMAAASHTVVADSTWLAERTFLLRQVRIELADHVVGPTLRQQIALEGDAQLEAAIGLLPRAKSVLAGER